MRTCPLLRNLWAAGDAGKIAPVGAANHFRWVEGFHSATFAVFVFAVSGALVASRKGLDVMSFMWLAVVTGVGGGRSGT
jgi:hypothetical protein